MERFSFYNYAIMVLFAPFQPRLFHYACQHIELITHGFVSILEGKLNLNEIKIRQLMSLCECSFFFEAQLNSFGNLLNHTSDSDSVADSNVRWKSLQIFYDPEYRTILSLQSPSSLWLSSFCIVHRSHHFNFE